MKRIRKAAPAIGALIVLVTLAGCRTNEIKTELPDSSAALLQEAVAQIHATPEKWEGYWALYVPGYGDQSIGEFDRAFAPYESQYYGYSPKEPDADFLQSLFFANMQILYEENGDIPQINFGTGVGSWDASVDIVWEVADKEAVTVAQRDALLTGCRDAARDALERLEQGGAKQQWQDALDIIAREYSAEWVTVRITADIMEQV